MFSLKVQEQLTKIFTAMNNKFFKGELPDTTLLILPAGRRQIYGYCTSAPVWGDREAASSMYEIALAAEHLDRGLEAICGTLLHEMVHLYCGINGIEDCKNQRHNKLFKREGESHGLHVYKSSSPRLGFGQTELTNDSKAWIASLDLEDSVFTMKRTARKSVYRPAKKKIKYACPMCGCKIESSEEGLSVICHSCTTVADEPVFFEEQY
jgi:hypothetical protein